MRRVEITYRYDDKNASVRPRPSNTDEAVLRLNDGNRTFAELLNSVTEGGGPVRRIVQVNPRDLGLLPDASAPSQRPFAAVLGCSDARVPLELIFNEGLNDLFVIRVAGNGLGSDVLGSLRYASSIWATASNSLLSSDIADAGPCPLRWTCSSIRAAIFHSLTDIRCEKFSIDCW